MDQYSVATEEWIYDPEEAGMVPKPLCATNEFSHPNGTKFTTYEVEDDILSSTDNGCHMESDTTERCFDG